MRGLRNLLYGGFAGLAFFLNACDGGGRHRRPPRNEPPQNELPRILSFEKSFRNDGRVHYRILAEDLDGFVVRVDTIYNDEPVRMHKGSEAVFSEEISREGDNILRVEIFDNEEGIGYGEDRFVIPSYSDALSFIQMRLDEDLVRGGFQGYEDTLVTLLVDEEQREIFPDFVLLRNDGLLAIIDYIGVGEDLVQKQEDHRWVHDLVGPHLYLFRLPLRDDAGVDIERAVDDFIMSGYVSHGLAEDL